MLKEPEQVPAGLKGGTQALLIYGNLRFSNRTVEQVLHVKPALMH